MKSRAKQESLFFGQVIHEALSLWYQSGELKPVYEYIDSCFEGHERDPEKKQARLLAYLMMTSYVDRYENEEWKMVGIDVEFTGTIRNPRTGAMSRTFRMAGKANGIVEKDGELYLLEHRTASTSEEIDPDKLWADTQSALYCYYLRQSGYPIVGVIYNILLKSRLQQKMGETEMEFEERRAELMAKNKSGKTSAQRQLPETDQEYVERLRQWYQKPEAFGRVVLRIPDDRLALLEQEIWEVTQQYLGSRRRGHWFLNTANCFHFGRPCEYLKYCQSGFDPAVGDELCEIFPPHEELPILGVNLRPEDRRRYEEVRHEKLKKMALDDGGLTDETL